VLHTDSFGGLKWENLLGRQYLSEEVRSSRGLPPAEDAAPPAADSADSNGSATTGGWKRRLRPLCYRWLKLGITLEVFARKTDGGAER